MRRRRRIQAARRAVRAYRHPPKARIVSDEEITEGLERIDSPMVEAVTDYLIAAVRNMNRDGLPPAKAAPQVVRDYFRAYAVGALEAAFLSQPRDHAAGIVEP